MKINNISKIINTELNSIMEQAPDIIKDFFNDSSFSSGKYLRAGAFLAFAGKKGKKAVLIASSIELLHLATLIHDDILDGAEFRRGNPALYIKRGVGESILYGDYLFSKALEILSSLKQRLFYEEMVLALSKTLEGEVVESAERGNTALPEKEYLGIVMKKSGSFFAAACKLGAIIRGLDESEADKAYDCGLKAGIAYQIIDDYYDYFDERASKKRFSDIKNGIITLPLIYLLKDCSKKESAWIKGILNGGYKSADTGKILSMMQFHRAAGKVLYKARACLEESISLFPCSLDEAAKSNFNIFCYIQDRIEHAEKKHSHSRRGVCRPVRA